MIWAFRSIFYLTTCSLQFGGSLTYVWSTSTSEADTNPACQQECISQTEWSRVIFGIALSISFILTASLLSCLHGAVWVCMFTERHSKHTCITFSLLLWFFWKGFRCLMRLMGILRPWRERQTHEWELFHGIAFMDFYFRIC